MVAKLLECLEVVTLKKPFIKTLLSSFQKPFYHLPAESKLFVVLPKKSTLARPS